MKDRNMDEIPVSVIWFCMSLFCLGVYLIAAALLWAGTR